MDVSLLDEWVPLLDPSAPPRVIGRVEALRRGYTSNMIEHRLRTGEWRRILPRTFLTADALTWPDRLNAALTFAGHAALLSGAAALADQGLRSVSRPTSVLVLVAPSARLRTTGWARIRQTHRLPQPALEPGPRRAPFARAVADLALERDGLDGVRALVAEAVRRQRCSLEELRAELAAGPRRGSRHLRQALAEVDAGAWSAPEARAATLLRKAGLGPFEQNARIDLPDGRHRVVDFLWRSLRAVLEIDSVEHHLDPASWRATMDRHLLLGTLGYAVVHRTPSRVRDDPAGFVREIAAWLAARRVA